MEQKQIQVNVYGNFIHDNLKDGLPLVNGETHCGTSLQWNIMQE
jgi:hypothetical protein